MNEEIKNYFKTDRSHSAGVALIIKHSNRLSLKKQVNIHPASEYMTGVIHEELRELAGISREELVDLLQRPISILSKELEYPEKTAATSATTTTNSEQLTSSPDEINAEKKASRKK